MKAEDIKQIVHGEVKAVLTSLSSLSEQLKLALDTLSQHTQRILIVEDALSAHVKAVTELNTKLQKQEQRITDIANNTLTTPIDIRAIIEDEKEKERKKTNIILFNLTETENEDENVKNIVTALEIPDAVIESTKRLGRKTITGKPRPLIISFDNRANKYEALKKSRALRNIDKYKHVVVKPDMTKLEQLKDRALVSELKQRRDAGENVKIKRGKIITL